MKRVKLLMISSVLLFISACVTINVYFPAAEAEDAASKSLIKLLEKMIIPLLMSKILKD